MPSPIVYTDIPQYNTQADVCDKLELLLRTSDRFRDFLEYAFDVAGNVSTDFATDIATAVGAAIGVPVGAVVWRPITGVPSGYVVANGQSLSRTTYANLFAVYGTNFGSDSSLTFRVPNLYDKFLVGGGDAYGVGSSGGEAEHTLTVAELAAHTHDIINLHRRPSAGSDAEVLSDPVANPTTPGSFPDMTTTDGSEGGIDGLPHNNLPPYFAGLWLIKT